MDKLYNKFYNNELIIKGPYQNNFSNIKNNYKEFIQSLIINIS